jgi:hypothetical protein
MSSACIALLFIRIPTQEQLSYPNLTYTLSVTPLICQALFCRTGATNSGKIAANRASGAEESPFATPQQKTGIFLHESLHKASIALSAIWRAAATKGGTRRILTEQVSEFMLPFKAHVSCPLPPVKTRLRRNSLKNGLIHNTRLRK